MQGCLGIAHRAGNAMASLAEAARTGDADVVELDVHLAAGRLEVRHTKALRPLPLLWDRWYLERAPARPLLLPDVLRQWPDGPLPMLDLKGAGGVFAAVAALLEREGPPGPVLVCSRWWPGVDAVAGRVPRVRPVLSVRGRTELAVLRRRRDRPWAVSVHRSLVTSALVAEQREAGVRTLTWPVDDAPALQAVLGAGVGGVISRDAGVLAALRSRISGEFGPASGESGPASGWSGPASG